MAVPLTRFFRPVVAGTKPDSPRTPLQRAAAGVGGETPPSSAAVGDRKRGVGVAVGTPAVPPGQEAKRPRNGSACEASLPTGCVASSGLAQAQALPQQKQPQDLQMQAQPPQNLQQHAKPSQAAQQLQVPQPPPRDLRAAVEAQRGIPAYIAECFHNYATTGAPYDWPSWLKPENLRDARGIRPGQPGYDQSTLLIPGEKQQKEEGHGTPMLLQYWKVKQKHFDKVAFFKVGKFYELFYYDACFGQHICDLKWMSADKKPHVGFPEVGKSNYAKQLVAAGYKIVVVEQVERVAEQQERKKQQSQTPADGSTTTCVEREPCEIFTKGTVVDSELLGNASAKYMMYLHFEEVGVASNKLGTKMSFSACLVDCATAQIRVSTIPDAPDRNALRTLIAQVQPSEAVYVLSNVPAEVHGLLRRLPSRPLLSPLHAGPTALAARDRLGRYRSAYQGRLSAAVESALSDDGAAIAAAGAIGYLESVMLDQRVLPIATWDLVDLPTSGSASASLAGKDDTIASPSPDAVRRMVLDANALAALEVLETVEGTYKGSLLEFLDHTSTQSGYRLLKQWLCAPLYDCGEIGARQEAVEFFIARTDITQRLRDGLRKVPLDLERVTSRVWGYALQAERRAVMYEDVTARRLGDFVGLLEAYEQYLQVLTILPVGDAMPKRIAHIASTRSRGGIFPELHEIIKRLKGSVVADSTIKKDTCKYRPKDGVDPTYTAKCRQIEGVKAQLDRELERLRKLHPGKSLIYTHRQVGYRYEVEVDEGALPQQFLGTVDVSSRLKDKIRFYTDTIKGLVAQLEQLEHEQEDCIFPFLARLFQEFYAHQAHFRVATRLISELDVLLSLSVASQGLTGAACRPQFVVPADPKEAGVLELRGCRHPVSASRMGASFVPNDTLLNAGGAPSAVVVTGPNMGGKSTVLRQTCVAVVMAQLGCRVNATACRLSPVDRIFTRIGSYDTILEGKSTLLTELEETAAILAHGTRRSLAVLDELGRGTSTFDGAAIASAVLTELAHSVRCMTLFATHYHPVSREATLTPEVAPFHMAAEVDPQTNEMTFLYRFLPGLCPASHGHNVARLAGLPASVLEEAVAKSAEFEREGGGAVGREDEVGDQQEALVCLAQAGDAEGLRALFRSGHLAGACPE